jgi:hypothetical protein
MVNSCHSKHHFKFSGRLIVAAFVILIVSSHIALAVSYVTKQV